MVNNKPKIKNQRPKIKIKDAKIIFIFLICVFGFWSLIFNFGYAQLTSQEERQLLEKDSNPPTTQLVMTPLEERKILEEELKQLEEKIARYEKDITITQQEKKTLQNQIYILKKKIEKLDLQIYQSSVIIKDLGLQIGDTESSIKKTSLKIENLREKLANILRLIYEEDQKPLIEILLSEPKLSDFFNNLMTLETLHAKNQELLIDIKALKLDLEKGKLSLEGEKEDLERISKIQALQKQESQKVKEEQERLLKITKGKESEYQEMLRSTQQRAAEIRARIFELIGVPKAPTFGEALDIAKYVERITGVRPAFLLAVLQQESALGRNVGQCYLVDLTTGDGVRVNTGKLMPRTMNPSRDVPHFLKITQELGRDPYKTLVSCPMSFGWGGAMGPAQFIPSTWMLYRDRLQSIIGKPADPWNIRDAFLAAGLYLGDYGAKARTRNGEWKAAMIYFSGSTQNPSFYWYADNVLRIAEGFEKDIEIIEKNNR